MIVALATIYRMKLTIESPVVRALLIVIAFILFLLLTSSSGGTSRYETQVRRRKSTHSLMNIEMC